MEERDAFAQRLKEKDKEKQQRSVMTQSKKKALEEAKQRLAMYEADRQALVPKLREQSRFKYLGERKVRLGGYKRILIDSPHHVTLLSRTLKSTSWRRRFATKRSSLATSSRPRRGRC